MFTLRCNQPRSSLLTHTDTHCCHNRAGGTADRIRRLRPQICVHYQYARSLARSVALGLPALFSVTSEKKEKNGPLVRICTDLGRFLMIMFYQTHLVHFNMATKTQLME